MKSLRDFMTTLIKWNSDMNFGEGLRCAAGPSHLLAPPRPLRSYSSGHATVVLAALIPEKSRAIPVRAARFAPQIDAAKMELRVAT